jgi:hypothetical protein
MTGKIRSDHELFLSYDTGFGFYLRAKEELLHILNRGVP